MPDEILTIKEVSPLDARLEKGIRQNLRVFEYGD